MMKLKRVPLSGGTKINIKGIELEIEKHIGEGSTCLAYYGKMADGRRVVVKEFYPEMSEIVRDSETSLLKIFDETKKLEAYQKKKYQFQIGYERQYRLANSNMMEFVVKPYLYDMDGDVEYTVSDVHMGESLEKVNFLTLADKLECMLCLTEMFGLLHKEHYIMTDFKPENILWIQQPKCVKLIDTDSIISTDDWDEDLEKEQAMVWANKHFAAPEMKDFEQSLSKGMSFLEKRDVYLVPQGNVYSLGLFLFELLFDEQKPEMDQKFKKFYQKKLEEKYSDEFKDKKISEKCMEVIYTALQEEAFERYEDASMMLNALKECVERLNAEKYRRKIAKANYTYLSYNLLEENPLYDYAIEENGKCKLETTIVGEHELRPHLLKAVISTAQMLHSELHINLLSEDAEAFWGKYCSEEKNPELGRTVCWDVKGELANSKEGIRKAEIVAEPLAYVHIHTIRKSRDVKTFLKEQALRHVVFLYANETKNIEMASELANEENASMRFVGYLAEKNHHIMNAYPIIAHKVSEVYNENIYKARIFNMGFRVHEYYYRRYNQNTSVDVIMEDYKSDFYNIESSERSALHAFYKLKSIGLDPKSEETPYMFYSKVVGNKSEEGKRLFSELAALEHRSWTAFMVLSGARTVNTKEELKRYAFDGRNDWKERSDSKNIERHPCLKYSLPGRSLTESVWKKRNELTVDEIENMDALDRQSLMIYDAICEVAEERRAFVDMLMFMIRTLYLGKATENMKCSYERLEAAKNRCYEQKADGAKVWNEAFLSFKETCKKEELLTAEMKADVERLVQLMRPVLWATRYHDFKQGDDDVLYALSTMLFYSDKKRLPDLITLVKPVENISLENLRSAHRIQPKRLILISTDNQNQEEMEYGYNQLRKELGLHTEIVVRDKEQLKRFGKKYGGKNGLVFWDRTGFSEAYTYEMEGMFNKENLHVFEFVDDELRSLDGKILVSLFL